jgi:outer membrane protein assembly factor BamB
MLWRADARHGALEWGYDSHTEAVRGGWPTLASGKVYLVDDGVNAVDAATGRGHRAELDAWGESLADGERLFAENDWYLDGYGLYLSAFDQDLHLLWRRDYNALARGVVVPDVGGLAMESGLLVHAAQHGPLSGSGVSAFDPASGERRWRAAVSPMSSPSISGGRVFTLERWPGEHVDRLAARSLADGELLWAHEMPDARGPAPVLASGMVVVHGKGSLVALEQSTGHPVWSTDVPRTAAPLQSATTAAAALGSGTLVVLSKATLHVLRIGDGTEVWSGTPVARAQSLEAPAIVGDAVYVVADGAVVRLEAAKE